MLRSMAEKRIDQFSPLGTYQQSNDPTLAEKTLEMPSTLEQVIDVSAGVLAPPLGVAEVTHVPGLAPKTITRSKSGRTHSQNMERQLPKFPHGLFNRRDWDIGRDFGKLEEIGRGKDTMIYKAVCNRPLGPIQEVGMTVAVKVYFKNRVSHTKLRAIKREVAMMSFMERKGIPNIVKAYTAFADDLHYYIVMEYCEGGDLLEWILERKKALHERDALSSIIIPLLNCLCQMHSLGIIHRDIKLENIFLGKNLRVMLGDFGLTMSSFQETAISPVGTVEYMAPEVLALPPVDMIINKAVDPKMIQPNDDKVDIWALGVTLFELVTGKLPFNGNDKNAIKCAIRNYDLASFPDCVSIGCRNIILDMLSYKSEDRPSAFTLKRRITRFLAGESPVLQPAMGIKQAQNSSNEESQTKMEGTGTDTRTAVDMDCNWSDVQKMSNSSGMRYSPEASVDHIHQGDHAHPVEEGDARTLSKPGLSSFGRVLRKLSATRKGKKLFHF